MYYNLFTQVSINILQEMSVGTFYLSLRMKNFTIAIKKLTDEALMREACKMTFLGRSRQDLNSMYRSEHSPVRTQLFWITANNIPLFVATHLIRHHVGSTPFQLTCRDDRSGGNPGLVSKLDSIISRLQASTSEDTVACIIAELKWLQGNSDRYTPVNLGLLVNAQSLIDMAKLRLCNQAHPETIEVFNSLKKAVDAIDHDLASMMVRKCVYRGGICGEPKCCGFNHSAQFQQELECYVQNFSDLQIGCCIQQYHTK